VDFPFQVVEFPQHESPGVLDGLIVYRWAEFSQKKRQKFFRSKTADWLVK